MGAGKCGANSLRNKLFCYVDESGKNRLKWYEASQRTRIAYIHGILSLLPREVQLCFAHYHDSLDYFALTVDAIANAVHRTIEMTPEQKTEPKVTALIDGLPKNQERMVGSLLRKRGIRIDKVRGVKREENDVLIRLADALCGFVRQSLLNVPEARSIFDEYIKNGRLHNITIKS
jgi:hypothetical protein